MLTEFLLKKSVSSSNKHFKLLKSESVGGSGVRQRIDADISYFTVNAFLLNEKKLILNIGSFAVNIVV